MIKVAVTGVNGFIGNELCTLLSATPNIHLTQISRQNVTLPTTDHINLNKITNDDLVERLSGYDCLIHLAAKAHAQNVTIEDLQRDNVSLSEKFAAIAAKAHIKHFVYLSSIKVLGNQTSPNTPFTNSSKPCPSDIYGQSKWKSEIAIAKCLSGSSTILTIVRPPLVWGPKCKGNLNTLINLINKGIPIPVAGIQNRRDIISLDNLCGFLKHLLIYPSSTNNTFLISDGKTRSTQDIVYLLETFAIKKARLISLPRSIFMLLKLLPGCRDKITSFYGNLEVDATETQHQLNWTPKN